MSDVVLFESLCKQADAAKDDIAKLHQLWLILKTNKGRLSEVEFDFAREHIGNYFEICENKIEGKRFEQKTQGE